LSELVTRLATIPGSVLALEFRAVPNAVDFGALGPAVGAAELVRVDPLEHHVGKPLTVDDQAGLLADVMPAPLRLVVTYCGTAALGLHVAARTGAAALLIDPFPVTAQDMRTDFARLCASLGIAADAAGDEPDLPRWEDMLLTSRTTLAETHGGDDEAYELVDDLLDRYRAWLRFLRASMVASPVAPAGEVTVVTTKRVPPLEKLLAASSVPRVRLIEEGTDDPGSPAVQALVSAAVDGFRESTG
jgi:hypothetical protein